MFLMRLLYWELCFHENLLLLRTLFSWEPLFIGTRSAGDGRWIPYEEKIADKLEEEYTTAAKVIFKKVF